ncbi:cyclophilin [Pseudoalteromonas carrageenovora]|uniref:peptidylprolyl isomerase n=1 Tax=Pseudoalteromonas carrageenovora IAM 12662 TaxID=1314868 RepID=A0A2K4XAL4_PSEVC|nr:peptidylprolyl isomerase [Pseudoalteromonas carrageenovora]MBE0383998.1 peptidylprolyl isomerase [Pseudoalteromonas carrageenovora IAM 12662]QBJ72241.1 cyclophilin [Pseudoalteromonas carrageenovora]GEB70758.1 peptidyl-prolyl cis-trans isomerase [Pseudoalteromonas carrageenovora]SOU41351.1 Cyclophilin [Pseudoalteromonas carrageenovora IAM 12662]
MKALYLAVLMTALTGCAQHSQTTAIAVSASDVIKNAKAHEWQTVSTQNILKITLPTGSAYIKLNPELAPKHTAHIKELAREGFYKDTSVYRFVEGFVAQGGDSSGNKKIQTANKTVPAEFYLETTQPFKITELKGDGYAPVTGFLNGFAVAQNQTHTQTWQVHCNGVFAMARDNDINSASTEFFVTIGQGPRYLDKNITVFGRVLEGMEHFNRLQRTPTDGVAFNPITNLQVLADVKNDKSVFKVMKTDSVSFKQLIDARKNRTEPWFVQSYNYVDVCAMPIPTKRID